MLLVAFFLLPLAARTRKPPAAATVDADYVAALGAANRFLHAWQADDQETAVLMLSDAVRQHTSEDRLNSFFLQSERQQAYEIRRGRKISEGHYRFPVALFASPGQHQWIHARSSQIEITRIGKTEWTVDKLP